MAAQRPNPTDILQPINLQQEGLTPEAQYLAMRSIEPSTLYVYNGALKKFSRWLGNERLTDDTLAHYLTHLHESGYSPAVSRTCIAAIQYAARLNAHHSPVGPATHKVFRGIKREGHTRGRGQATGISFKQAIRMAQLSASTEPAFTGLRDAAIISIARDALLRVSEIEALNIADITFSLDGTGSVYIAKSKTDQEGKGQTLFLGPPTIDHVNSWLEHAKINRGPLFRPWTNPHHVSEKRLTRTSIGRAIVRRARAAGLRGRITSHSLRIGSTQDLVTLGATIADLQIVGRWSSPSMPARYARNQLAGKSAVAKLFYGYKPTL